MNQNGTTDKSLNVLMEEINTLVVECMSKPIKIEETDEELSDLVTFRKKSLNLKKICRK